MTSEFSPGMWLILPWYIGRAMRKPVGILNVKVVRAVKLEKKDIMGSSDPYVKLKLTDDKLPMKKTTVKHKNLNPEWNEEFSFVVKDPEIQALEIKVYDWEKVQFFGCFFFLGICLEEQAKYTKFP